MATGSYGCMSEEDNARITEAWPHLLRDMEPKEMVISLMEDGILTDDDFEVINQHTTQSDRAYELLRIYKRNASTLEPLIKALNRNAQQHLSQLLEAKPTSKASRRPPLLAPQIRSKFSMGGVPPLPSQHVSRVVQKETLECALTALALKDAGWTVVQGMGGAGKSTLVCDTLRNTDLLAKRYYMDVFWIKLEMGVHSQKQTIITTLNNLYAKMTRKVRDIVGRKFDDVELAIDCVREIIVMHFPKLLIVLDDVWSEEVVRAFDALECRILASSRKPTVFKVAATSVQYVPLVPNGFTFEEAVQVFMRYVGSDTLPPEAKLIFDLCDGHPLVISLVGSLVAEHSDRWGTYYDALRGHDLDQIDRISSYRHSSFNKAAELSYEDLSPDRRDKYKHLAIFPLGVLIPDCVLATVWNADGDSWVKQLVHVQDISDEFKERSLLQDHPQSVVANQLRRHKYGIHALLHAFLKRKVIKDPERKSVTGMLIDHLTTALSNQPFYDSNFEDYRTLEEFLCHFIGYFLFKSARYHQFGLWYLNLEKLALRLKHVNASLLLAEFNMYGKMISRYDDSGKKDDVVVFLRRNARFSSCTEMDLVQLGLLEPRKSAVYQEALALAQKRGGVYFVPRQFPCNLSDCLLSAWVGVGPILKATYLNGTNLKETMVIVASRDNPKLCICCSKSGYSLEQIELAARPTCVSSSDTGDVAVCTGSREIHIYRPNLDILARDMRAFELNGLDQKTPSPVMRFLSADCSTLMDSSMDQEMFAQAVDQTEARRSFDTPALIIRSDNAVLTCAQSSDGQYVAAVCDSNVLIWNLKMSLSDPVKRFGLLNQAGDTQVQSWLQFSRFDGELFLSAGLVSGQLCVWNVTTDELVAKWTEADLRGFKMVSLERMLTVSKSVRLWKLCPKLNLLCEKQLPHASLALCVDVTADGTHAAVGLHDFTIQMYELRADAIEFVTLLSWHSGWVHSVQFATDSPLRLLSAGEDESFVIWDASRAISEGSSRRSVSHMDVKEYYGRLWMATVDSERCIQVCPTDELNECAEQTNGALDASPKAQITALALCKTQMLLAVAHDDKLVKIYKFGENGRQLVQSVCVDAVVVNLLFSPKSAHLIALTQHQHSLIRLDTNTGEKLVLVDVSDETGTIGQFMFEPSGQRLYLAVSYRTNANEIMSIDMNNPESPGDVYQAENGSVLSLDISTDGAFLIAGCTSAATLHLLPSLTAVCTLSAGSNVCYRRVCLGQRGSERLAAVADDQQCITVFKIRSSNNDRKLSSPIERLHSWKRAHESNIVALRFSADGRYLVSLSRTLKVWALDQESSSSVVQSYPLVGSHAIKLFVSDNFDRFVLLDAVGGVYVIDWMS